MVRTLLVLLLIAGAAFLVYRKTALVPSEEEQMVTSIRERYTIAVTKFLNAQGRAGTLGLDSTFDSETAAGNVLKLRAELAKLRQTLTKAKAIRKAEGLAEKIENFCKKNDIIRP